MTETLVIPKDASTIEFHYWLDNPTSHSMDAFVQHKCEQEVLGAIRALAKTLDFSIAIETVAIGEGGLVRTWTVIAKEEAKKAPIATALIVSLLTQLFTTPITELMKKGIEKMFEDSERKQMEKEKLQRELDELRKNQSIDLSHDENIILKKRASNFYEQLEKYGKVRAVSISGTLVGEHELKKEDVNRSEFAQFIVAHDELPSIIDENALIEIIAPVLKRGKFKWLGIYNGETIHFSMRSTEFKEMVQYRQVEFKNGSAIFCLLEIKRKVDADGEPKITSFEVQAVNEYVENDSPIETPEGRRRRRAKEDKTKQPNLFEDPQ